MKHTYYPLCENILENSHCLINTRFKNFNHQFYGNLTRDHLSTWYKDIKIIQFRYDYHNELSFEEGLWSILQFIDSDRNNMYTKLIYIEEYYIHNDKDKFTIKTLDKLNHKLDQSIDYLQKDNLFKLINKIYAINNF